MSKGNGAGSEEEMAKMFPQVDEGLSAYAYASLQGNLRGLDRIRRKSVGRGCGLHRVFEIKVVGR